MASNIRVPGQLAQAGFNGLSFLESLPMQITSTRTPRFEIGTAAAQFVSGQAAENAVSETIDFGVELMAGNTS